MGTFGWGVAILWIVGRVQSELVSWVVSVVFVSEVVSVVVDINDDVWHSL